MRVSERLQNDNNIMPPIAFSGRYRMSQCRRAVDVPEEVSENDRL